MSLDHQTAEDITSLLQALGPVLAGAAGVIGAIAYLIHGRTTDNQKKN